MKGSCRYCQCTEAAACEGGCAWVDDTETLCTQCAEAAKLAEKVVEIFGMLRPRARPPIAHLPAPAWADLTFEQQQLLVMAHRRIVEADREALIEEMTHDAVDALVSLGNIVKFVNAHCPQELQADEPVDELVIRLLEPHVGKRVVLAGGPLS